MNPIFHIHFSDEEHLGCFHLLTIITKAPVKQQSMCPCGMMGHLLGVCPGAIAGSSGRTISHFLRNCQFDFQSGCTSLHSHQQGRSAPLTSHHCQHVLLLEFLVSATLIVVVCLMRSHF